LAKYWASFFSSAAAMLWMAGAFSTLDFLVDGWV